MRSVPGHFTMRRTAKPPKGDWFRIENAVVADGDTDDVTKVYIYDEIGFWGTSAEEFVQQLMTIATNKIHLHLNSPGGEVFDGVAIYNALKSHPAEVTVFVDALAASAASFIAQSGDKIVMTRNATMMIHDGIGICIGNAQDMRATGTILDKLSNNIADIYAQAAGGTVEEWRALMVEEMWYNASEAVEAGLADEVLDEEDNNAESAKNQWDLSFFNYSSRDAAPSPKAVKERVLVLNSKEKTGMARRTTNSSTDGGGDGGGQTPETPAPGTEGQGTEPQSQPDGGAGRPDTDPDAETTEGSPPQPTSTEPAGETPPGGDTQPTNRAGQPIFTMNGRQTTDHRAVQTHINSLEQFRNETREAGRRSFVEGLARQNRIAASAIDDTTEFALELSDDQFKKWKASMESALPSSVLGQHGGGPEDQGRPENGPGADAEKQQRIADLKDIVATHRASGMDDDVLKTKNSYIELKKLDPDFE